MHMKSFNNKFYLGNHMSLSTSISNGYILRTELIDSVLSKVIACMPSKYKKIRAQVKKL